MSYFCVLLEKNLINKVFQNGNHLSLRNRVLVSRMLNLNEEFLIRFTCFFKDDLCLCWTLVGPQVSLHTCRTNNPSDECGSGPPPMTEQKLVLSFRAWMFSLPCFCVQQMFPVWEYFSWTRAADGGSRTGTTQRCVDGDTRTHGAVEGGAWLSGSRDPSGSGSPGEFDSWCGWRWKLKKTLIFEQKIN